MKKLNKLKKRLNL